MTIPLPLRKHLSTLTDAYNALLDSTWERSKTLGSNARKGKFKLEQSNQKKYEYEKAEMVRIEAEIFKIGQQIMEGNKDNI